MKLLSLGRRRRAAESPRSIESALQPALVDGRWRIPDRFNFTRDVVEIFADDIKRQALTFLAGDGIIEPHTFRQLAEGASSWAAHLREKGVRPGDRVLVLVGRNPDWIEVMLAGIKVGAVIVPCPETLSAAALDIRISSSDAKLVVAARTSEAELVQTAERPTVIYVDELPRLTDREPAEVPTHDTASRDLAFLLSTSATASGPRGVAHSHGAVFAARAQAEHWLGAGPGHIVWCPADSGSALAVWNVLVGPWSRGAEIILHDGPFDPEERLDLIRRLEVTILCQTPAEYRTLSEMGERMLRRYRPYRLRRMVSTGDYLSPDVIAAFESAWDLTIHDGYGQVETGVVAGYGLGTGFRTGSMGLPLPGYEVAVLDENGSDLPPGAEGELAVLGRPPSLLVGYWESPDETKAAFRGDAYLTGDVVTRDEDGFLWFLGRAQDVITSGGIRFSPVEVEEALVANEAIEEAGVVGIRDLERGGQFVRAFVVLKPGIEGSDRLVAELREHVRQSLPDHKVPREIEFVDALPTTQNGKLRRLELRERLVVGPEPVWTAARPPFAPEVQAVPDPEFGPLADVIRFEERLPDFVVPPAKSQAEARTTEPAAGADEPLPDYVLAPADAGLEPPRSELELVPEPTAEAEAELEQGPHEEPALPVVAQPVLSFVDPFWEEAKPAVLEPEPEPEGEVEQAVEPEETAPEAVAEAVVTDEPLPDYIAHPASDYEDIPFVEPEPEALPEPVETDAPLPDYIAHPASDYEQIPVPEPEPEPEPEALPELVEPDAPLPDYIAHPASDYEQIPVPEPEPEPEPAAADTPLPEYVIAPPEEQEAGQAEPEQAASVLEPEPIPEPEPPPEPEPEPEPEPGPEPVPEPVLDVAEEDETGQPEETVWKIVSAPPEEPAVDFEPAPAAEATIDEAEAVAEAEQELSEEPEQATPRKRGLFRRRRRSAEQPPELVSTPAFEPVAEAVVEPQPTAEPVDDIFGELEPEPPPWPEEVVEPQPTAEPEPVAEVAPEREPVLEAVAEIEPEPAEEPTPEEAAAVELSAEAMGADEEPPHAKAGKRGLFRRRRPSAEPAPEPEAEPVAEAVAEPESEPVLDIVFESASEAEREFVFEHVPEPEPLPEPEIEREPEPEQEPVAEFVFEPEPVVEAVAEVEEPPAEEPAPPEPLVLEPPVPEVVEEEPPEPRRRGRKKVAAPSGKKQRTRRSAPEPGEEGDSVDWMHGLSSRLSAYSLSDDNGEPSDRDEDDRGTS